MVITIDIFTVAQRERLVSNNLLFKLNQLIKSNKAGKLS